MSQAKRFTENKLLKLAHRLWDSNEVRCLLCIRTTQRYTLWISQLVAQIAYSEGMGDG